MMKIGTYKTYASDQAPLREPALTDALASLALTSRDVFCDIGCGDGRVLIAAVRRYRCQAVGIEIDPLKANEARAKIREAVQDGRIRKGSIKVVTGDATKFDPTHYGITAAVAYLWPETLAEIKATVRKVPRVAVPFHQIEGVAHTARYKDNYLYFH